MNEMETVLKQLLRNLDVEGWRESLRDKQFAYFLGGYLTEKRENVYHLLVKNIGTKNVELIQEIISLLIANNVSILNADVNNKYTALYVILSEYEGREYRDAYEYRAKYEVELEQDSWPPSKQFVSKQTSTVCFLCWLWY